MICHACGLRDGLEDPSGIIVCSECTELLATMDREMVVLLSEEDVRVVSELIRFQEKSVGEEA